MYSVNLSVLIRKGDSICFTAIKHKGTTVDLINNCSLLSWRRFLVNGAYICVQLNCACALLAKDTKCDLSPFYSSAISVPMQV